jgi:hypothetical protein
MLSAIVIAASDVSPVTSDTLFALTAVQNIGNKKSLKLVYPKANSLTKIP